MIIAAFQAHNKEDKKNAPIYLANIIQTITTDPLDITAEYIPAIVRVVVIRTGLSHDLAPAGIARIAYAVKDSLDIDHAEKIYTDMVTEICHTQSAKPERIFDMARYFLGRE